MRSRRRKKKESPAKAVFLALLAIFVMVCAVSVVLGVYQKIKENYESLEQGKPAQTLQETVAIDSDDVTGWISSEEGYRYRNEDGSFAEDEWKEIGGYLYRFDESGLLKTGEWKEEGQIFTASGEGYLTDMNQDPDYVPEDTGENLDNLVKANAYWCYLGESQGLFKPIMYRRATETEVTALGGSASPEMTTKNSLRAYGDYVYYLPKVDSSKTSSLTEEEKKRCDVLVRIIPGSGQKEIIADHVSGYLVLWDKIYYAQNQKIYAA